MLEYRKLEADSKILGKTVVEVIFKTGESPNYTTTEEEIIKKYNPDYIQLNIQSSEISLVQYFEMHGFRFIDFRLVKVIKIDDNLPNHEDEFSINEISNEDEFEQLSRFAKGLTFDDRYSMDPLFDSEKAVRRNVEFVRWSLINQDEFLLSVSSKQGEKILGFFAGKQTSGNSVSQFFLMMDPELSHEVKKKIQAKFYRYLLNKGINFVNLVTSANNRDELNLSVCQADFTILDTRVILRKLFSKP